MDSSDIIPDLLVDFFGQFEYIEFSGYYCDDNDGI